MLKEPESEWWQELRVLLKYKQYTLPILRRWAGILARVSSATHRVPEKTILRRMRSWKFNLTVGDILEYRGSDSQSDKKPPIQDNNSTQNKQKGKTSWQDDFVVDLADDASGKHPNNRIVVDLSQVNTQGGGCARGVCPVFRHESSLGRRAEGIESTAYGSNRHESLCGQAIFDAVE